MNLKRLFLFILASFGLFSGTLLLWFYFFGPEQYYHFDPLIDTETSAGFTEKKFHQITIGMDRTDVLKLLGEPLYKGKSYIPAQTEFQYTRDGKLMKAKNRPFYLAGDYAWLNATLTLDENGKVCRKIIGWHYD